MSIRDVRYLENSTSLLGTVLDAADLVGMFAGRQVSLLSESTLVGLLAVAARVAVTAALVLAAFGLPFCDSPLITTAALIGMYFYSIPPQQIPPLPPLPVLAPRVPPVLPPQPSKTPPAGPASPSAPSTPSSGSSLAASLLSPASVPTPLVRRSIFDPNSSLSSSALAQTPGDMPAGRLSASFRSPATPEKDAGIALSHSMLSATPIARHPSIPSRGDDDDNGDPDHLIDTFSHIPRSL